MAKISTANENIKIKTLHAAAKLFLEKGYSNSTTREIAGTAGINVSAMNRAFGSKENILCELVSYVLEGQFEAASEMVKDITDDPVLFYAAETTLQLYMAESNENIRNLYAAAYSLPNTSDIIQRTITGKLEHIFHEYLPDLETKDFYELEIASGGIMRGFMSKPCDMYFTMERKVTCFLKTTFLIYEIPKDKIYEAIEFVGRFNYPDIAEKTIQSMLGYLEEKTISRIRQGGIL